LPAAVIADFEAWIKMGTPDPRDGSEKTVVKKYTRGSGDSWTFQKPKKGELPPVQNAAWTKNDVDRYLFAKLEEQGLQPNSVADRRTILRRLSFDLIGLPPTPEEIQAFLKDSSADALEKQVDRLLASSHFGERWGRHWLDVAHYAENSGVVKYNTLYSNAWRYRDYVIAAFNNDKPYNQFVREQIAGDLLPVKTPREKDQNLIATGFLVMGRLRAGNIPLAVAMDNVDEQIDATTQGFLGLTVSCARCHDHKFDPISTKDYYALAGIFKSTTPALAGGGKAGRNAITLSTGADQLAMGVQEGKVGDTRVLIRGDVDQQADLVGRGIPAVFGKVAITGGHSGRLQLADWLASPDNPLTARVMVNRIWHHLFGRGLVPTVDNFGAMSEPCSHPELLDYLAVRFMEEGWSVKKMIRTLVLTRAYQASSDFSKINFEKDAENLYLWRQNPRRLQAEAIRDAMLSVSGKLNRAPFKGSLINQGFVLKKKGNSGSAGDHNHRSVYLPVLREGVHEMMKIFDFADPSLVFGRREITTVPTQALFLMNNPFVLGQAEGVARRVLAVKDLDEVGRISLAFELTTGRQPASTETQRVQAFLADYAKALGERNEAQRDVRTWASFCQALFESAEFRYVK
jgi:hypothetical protein